MNNDIDTPDVDTPDIDTGRLIAFAQDLVRIPSVFDPDRGLNEEPAAELVADLMRSSAGRRRSTSSHPGGRT